MIPRNTPIALTDAPLIQWANGWTLARDAGGRFGGFIGFHSEVGRSEPFDRALTALHVPVVEIKHQRQGGSEIKAHWALGAQLRLFPITAGPPATTMGGLVRQAAPAADAGLGVRWQHGEKSRLAVRGFVAVGLADAWSAPILQVVQLVARSKLTDRLLVALLDHYRAIVAADALIDRTRHPAAVAYHELALPLGDGPEEDWGAAESTAVTPLRSLHPATIDKAYLKTRGLWRDEALDAAAGDAWDGIVAWARGYAAGDDGDLNGAVE